DEVALAAILLDHRPGADERIVDGRYLVDQDVKIALVERDALPDDGLVVFMQRKAGGLEGARALEIAGFGLERVVAAIAIGIEPLADRVARERRLLIGREAAPVGIDAARHVILEIDISDLWQDHELGRPDDRHDARHAGRNAGKARVLALPAF